MTVHSVPVEETALSVPVALGGATVVDAWALRGFGDDAEEFVGEEHAR